MTELLSFVPELRLDLLRRDIDDRTVVWSPLAPEPVVLDPVARILLDVFDGEATVEVIASEVSDEVGISREAALSEVGRVVELFGATGLLTASKSTTTARDEIAGRELFVNPCSSCMREAARSMTQVDLRFDELEVGIACYPPRLAKRLRSALDTHVVELSEPAEIGFVLTGPVGLQRSHHLTDRSGFVHSAGRGASSALRGIAGHLTAFLEPAPGKVRVRAGVVVGDTSTVVCVFPVLFAPMVTHDVLAARGHAAVDRLAVDIDVATGRVSNPDIPWPALADLDPARGHVARAVDAAPNRIVIAVAPGNPAPTRANVVATLAAGALAGSPEDILDALVRLTDDVEVVAMPFDAAATDPGVAVEAIVSASLRG